MCPELDLKITERMHTRRDVLSAKQKVKVEAAEQSVRVCKQVGLASVHKGPASCWQDLLSFCDGGQTEKIASIN